MLVAFTAKMGVKEGSSELRMMMRNRGKEGRGSCGALPPALAIHLSCHISRLYVRKKYGAKYGGNRNRFFAV